MNGYNECIVANKEWLDSNPDLTRRIVRAVFKGWKYAIDHPEEAVTIISKLFPEQDKHFNMLGFNRILPLLYGPNGKADSFGVQTTEGWQKTIDLLYGLKLIDFKPEPSKVFTNDFLPATRQ